MDPTFSPSRPSTIDHRDVHTSYTCSSPVRNRNNILSLSVSSNTTDFRNSYNLQFDLRQQYSTNPLSSLSNFPSSGNPSSVTSGSFPSSSSTVPDNGLGPVAAYLLSRRQKGSSKSSPSSCSNFDSDEDSADDGVFIPSVWRNSLRSISAKKRSSACEVSASSTSDDGILNSQSSSKRRLISSPDELKSPINDGRCYLKAPENRNCTMTDSSFIPDTKNVDNTSCALPKTQHAAYFSQIGSGDNALNRSLDTSFNSQQSFISADSQPGEVSSYSTDYVGDRVQIPPAAEANDNWLVAQSRLAAHRSYSGFAMLNNSNQFQASLPAYVSKVMSSQLHSSSSGGSITPNRPAQNIYNMETDGRYEFSPAPCSSPMDVDMGDMDVHPILPSPSLNSVASISHPSRLFSPVRSLLTPEHKSIDHTHSYYSFSGEV